MSEDQIVASDIGLIAGSQQYLDDQVDSSPLYDKPIQMKKDRLLPQINNIINEYNASVSDNQPYIDQIKKDRETISDNPPVDGDDPWENSSQIVMPVCLQQILTLYTNISIATLSGSPVARISRGGNVDPEGFCEPMERFIHELVANKTSWLDKNKAALYMSLRDRTAIIYTYWRREKKLVRTWKVNTTTEQLTDGTTVDFNSTYKKHEEVTEVYDYPDFKVLPADQFGTMPASNGDIQESNGVWARFNFKSRELLEMSEGDSPLYDKEQVEKVIAGKKSYITLQTPEDVAHSIGNQNPTTDDERQDIELIEVYWRIASQTDGNPAEDWLFTIDVQTGRCLRAVPNPWWHGKRPFHNIRPYPAAFGIYGNSVISAGGRQYQNAKSSFIRMAFNQMALLMQPPLAIAENIFARMDKLLGRLGIKAVWKPRGRIEVPNAFAESGRGIQAFTPGAQPMTVPQMLSYLDGDIQRVGANDAMQGIATTNTITATQAQQMDTGSHSLLGLFAINVSAAQGEQLAMIVQLCYQFMGQKKLREIWAQVNGEAINKKTQLPMTLEDALMVDYNVVSSGLTQTSNAAKRASQMTQLLGILSNEPNVMGDTESRYNLIHDVTVATGVDDAERYLKTVQVWEEKDKQRQQQQAAAAQAQQQMEMAKAGGGGGGEQPMMPPTGDATGMPPEMMAQSGMEGVQ